MMEVVRVCTMKTLLRFTGAGDRKNPAAGERSFVPAMWEKSSERGIVRKGQVEGEQRLWVHLAIDRLTGQLLDKQIEVVQE